MASKRLMKEIYEQFLVCKICLETYKQPKTLACLHIFCTECLEKHVEADYERTYRYLLFDRNIICPICRGKTDLPTGGVRRLPDSFLVANLSQVVHRRRLSAQMPSCQICQKSRTQFPRQTATAKCLECYKFLCEECVLMHRKTRVTRGHSLIEVGGEKDIECKIHQDEMVRFYCERCEQCVCIVCMFQEHRGHEVSSFRDSIERHQNSLDELLNTCKDRLYILQESLNLITKCESTLKNNETMIRDSAIETIASIRQKEREMIQDLHGLYGEEAMDFIKNKEALLEMVQTMSNTCNVTEVIVQNKGIELLLLKREIKDKLSMMLERSMFTAPLKPSFQVYFVPGTVVLGHLSVNGMGMEVPENGRSITAGPTGLPMITGTDAGCSASSPSYHMPYYNQHRSDAACAAMTNSFTMTIEPEMYESQTMTDSVDVVKRKVQTEPVDVREAGVETMRVYSTSVYTNTLDPLRCDRSTHTKKVSFNSQVTDTNGLVKCKDSETDMIAPVLSNSFTETDKVVTVNRGSDAEVQTMADKMTGTIKVTTLNQVTSTPHIIMLDMATQAKSHGIDKNVGTRAIVTEDLAVGDHNVFTKDQFTETCSDMTIEPSKADLDVIDILKEQIAYYKEAIKLQNKSLEARNDPVLVHRACSPVRFPDEIKDEAKVSNVVLVEEKMDTDETQQVSVENYIVNGLHSKNLETRFSPQCQEMEIQTDWSIDHDLIMPSLFPKAPDWKDFGVPEEPELSLSIEHQHLVHCSCGPDSPMSYDDEPAVDLSRYKLIMPTEEASMCTDSQQTKNAYTDMGVEAEMEDIMYAVMSGWDSYRRSSSSTSHRSSMILKSCVDRSTNTQCRENADQQTMTHQPEFEDRGTGTPQVISFSKNVETTPVETNDRYTVTYVPTVEKATYMVQPVYLSTGTSTPVPEISHKTVNTTQVDTRDWSSMTSSVRMCDSQTSMDLSSSPMDRSFQDTSTKSSKTIEVKDSSSMTHIETADVAILKRPHTRTRGVCTLRKRTADHDTCTENISVQEVSCMTNPVTIVDDVHDRSHTSNQPSEKVSKRIRLITRGTGPVCLPGHDQSVMVVPESDSKEVTAQPDTRDKTSSTRQVMLTDMGVGTHRTTFTDKETCTPQIHTMHKNISTENQTTADKQTNTTDICAAYRDLISQESIRSSCSRGTCTDPPPPEPEMVDKGSSPLKLVRTRDKGIMVNKASFVEADDKFQKAGSLTNRLSDSMEGELHYVPSLESITESIKEQSSEDEDSSMSGSITGTPPVMHKERLWNVTPNGHAKFSRDSMFSVNAGAQSTFIKCCVETGTSTRNISMEDKAISTEAFVVDGRVAECISKLRTVRQRLENQPSSSSGSRVSTLSSVAPEPIYSRASMISSQPVTLPSTATVDVATCTAQQHVDVTTVTTVHRKSRMVGDRVPTQPIPIPEALPPGLDSPSLRSKARKFKLNMTQMLSNSPSEEDSPPTPPTSKSKMRGPMYGRRVEKKGLPGFRKEKLANNSPKCSSPEEARRAVSSPERLREKLKNVPELLTPFRVKSDGCISRPRMDRPRPRGGNFDDVKLGRGLIPVMADRRSRESTPPPPLQCGGDIKLQRLTNSTTTSSLTITRSQRESRGPRLNPVTDIEIENLKESDV